MTEQSDPVTAWIISPEGQARIAAAAVPADLVATVNTTLGETAANILQMAWVIADPTTHVFPLEPKAFAAKVGIDRTSGFNTAIRKLTEAGHVVSVDAASACLVR